MQANAERPHRACHLVAFQLVGGSFWLADVKRLIGREINFTGIGIEISNVLRLEESFSAIVQHLYYFSFGKINIANKYIDRKKTKSIVFLYRNTNQFPVICWRNPKFPSQLGVL